MASNPDFYELPLDQPPKDKGAGKGNRQAKKEVALQAVHKASKSDAGISGGSHVYVADKIEVTINFNF